MTSRLDLAFFQALPKAELHAHLSGSISPETFHEIWLRKRARNECLDLADPLTEIHPGRDGFVDINTFFPLFDKYIYSLCTDLDSVKFATKRVLEDFEKDGVRYLELRTTPRECSYTGMTKKGYVEAIGQILNEWNAKYRERMEVYLILSVDRKMTAIQAAEVIDLALDHQHRADDQHGFVVGVDLCGNPVRGDVSIFTHAFLKAKTHGLGLTVHFAEVPQSGTARELETILSWSPDRLGHCIHVPTVIAKSIEERKIGLELCISCNVLASMTSGGYSNHHLGEWLRRDCPIALGTDDVGVFGSPLSMEFMIVAQTFIDTKEDIIALARRGVLAAFAGKDRMMKLLDGFETNG